MTDPEPIFWAVHELIASAPLRNKPRAGILTEREPGKSTWRVVEVRPGQKDRIVAVGLSEQEAERCIRENMACHG